MQPPQAPPLHQQYTVPAPVFIGAVLLVGLAFICGLGAIGAVPSLHGLKSPTVTPTPPQPLVHAATLGGTLGDFAQRYGKPLDASSLMYAATVAGQRVLIVVALLDDSRQSRDGKPRVIGVVVQVPNDASGVETWDAATSDTIARTFFPADARFQRTISINGELHHFYHSDALAATFLPGQYTSVPGSLNYTCHPWPPTLSPPTASGYGQCVIIFGTDAAVN